MAWHFRPQHQFGRHAIPDQPIRPASRRTTTITATYSTFAACERQLTIRDRMLHAIAFATIPTDFTPSLACFSASASFATSEFYGLTGCAPH